MSGIAGVFHRDGAPAGVTELEPMLAAMDFRGPDGTSQTHDASVALGHSQLCITPESREEQQPVQLPERGITLVMDGWLSNWQALRGALLAEGCVLRNRSDPELVIHAYARWGERFTEHLEGDFAIALWDASAQRLLCVRDPIGNRPFVYFASDSLFVFATDVAAVLAHPAVPREPDLTHLANYLALNWHSTESTFWQGVQRLPAAHSLAVSADRTQKNRYWLPRLDTPLHYRDERDYVAHYRSLLFDSVRSHCRSATPVAFEVSGGLDSSALFAVGADLQRKGKLPAPGLKGYTMDYSHDPDADELVYCRAVAAHVGLPVVEVAPTTVPLATLRGWAAASACPPGLPNGVDADGLVQRAASDGARVVINGLGGDDWLGFNGGNLLEALPTRYRHVLAEERAHAGIMAALAMLVHSALATIAPAAVRGSLRSLGEDARGERYVRRCLSGAMKRRVQSASSPGATRVTGGLRRRALRAKLAMLDSPALPWLLESNDRLLARSGLEIRSPLWSTTLVQFSIDVPTHQLYRCGVDRRLHRQAMQGLLPPVVLARTDKAEFSVAYARYFSGQLPDELQRIIACRGGWIDQSRAENMLAARAASHYRYEIEQALWSLFESDALF